MDVYFNVKLDEHQSQRYFSEMTTEIKIIVKNAEIMAQKTEYYFDYYTSDDGKEKYIVLPCSDESKLIEAYIKKKGVEEAIKNRTKEVVLDMARIIEGIELIISTAKILKNYIGYVGRKIEELLEDAKRLEELLPFLAK